MAEESLSEQIASMNLQGTDEEDAQKDTGSARGELIIFNVSSKGGKNTRTKQILKDENILNGDDPLCVEAYSEKTIEEALKIDGRFADSVFQSGCKLQSCDERHEISISEKVRDLTGHFYKICLPRNDFSNMPDFEEIYKILRSQFRKFPEECLQLMEDFKQRTGSFSTNGQQQLVNLGTAVCTVKTEKSQGTGFLLFDNFILTNAHVIEESYDSKSKTLKGKPTVNFNIGSGTALNEELSSDVFAFLKGRDDAGRYVDFALLKLQTTPTTQTDQTTQIAHLPRLLKEYTSNQHAGGICIIDHPGSDVNRMDVSRFVPHTETRSAPAASILVHFRFPSDYIQSEHKIVGFSINTYSTYFLKGSFGSPVFDKDCKLVAMHTGGFLADETRGRAIGFAIPLHSIIQNFIKQLASREDLDAMFKFIEAAAQNPDLKEYLEECAEEMKRNLTRNTKMLAKICLKTRNGMPNLSQMIYEALNTNIE